MGDRPIRVFLDTNVILSGLHSDKSPPATILESFIRGEILVVISRRVLDEAIRAVSEKLPRALPLLHELLEQCPPEIYAEAGGTETSRWEEYLDQGDAAILAAAVKAEPDAFVTGDRHFLGRPVLAEKAKLRIISPAAFVKELSEPSSA